MLVQPSKLYFVNLNVLNKFPGPVQIKFSDNIPPNGIVVEAKTISNIKKKTKAPTAITVHAEDPVSKKPAFVNDLPNIRVTPTEFEEQVSAVVVSTKSGIVGKSRNYFMFTSVFFMCFKVIRIIITTKFVSVLV